MATPSTGSIVYTPITTFAMTSIFTPPASCSNSWTYEPVAANNVPGGLLLQNAAADDHSDTSCFPPNFAQYERRAATVVFSPGFCPVGYTSADLAVDQPTTTAICCLSHYTYFTLITDDAGLAVFAGCTRMLPSTSSTIVTVRETEGHSTQVTGPITMWAQPITVELQSSDLSLFVTEDMTTITTATTIANISTTPLPPTTSTQPTTPADSTNSSSSHGLSTGAGVGIGVGVGIGGLAILGAVGLWLFRRRRTSKASSSPVHDHDPYQGLSPPPGEAQVQATATRMAMAKPYNTPTQQPFELDGAGNPNRVVKHAHELHG
ncbi:hypothetical protein BJY01DRAFT_254900 [Aspergillus pseudoustus]|uniref:Uncharacterized protein n=1 Tax=Aspergillus pseudoustus TaxID=1810923 RepID=A0ABR4IPZ7_9EURO